MFETSVGYPGNNDLLIKLDLYIRSCKKKLGLLVAELSVESSVLTLSGSIPAGDRMNPRWFNCTWDLQQEDGKGNNPGE